MDSTSSKKISALKADRMMLYCNDIDIGRSRKKLYKYVRFIPPSDKGELLCYVIRENCYSIVDTVS